MNIEITPATDDDYTVVQNLIRFYVYDMSEVMGWACPASGLFGGSDDQPYYWGRVPEGTNAYWPCGWLGYAFLVRVKAELAGFSLVKRTSEAPPTYDIGEFFVLRKFRRQGIGKHVAFAMFDRFPGNWEVRQYPGNLPAVSFWKDVVSEYANGRHQETREHFDVYDDDFIVQRFRSKADC